MCIEPGPEGVEETVPVAGEERVEVRIVGGGDERDIGRGDAAAIPLEADLQRDRSPVGNPLPAVGVRFVRWSLRCLSDP
jgi:hypothetical protein